MSAYDPKRTSHQDEASPSFEWLMASIPCAIVSPDILRELELADQARTDEGMRTVKNL